VDGSKRKRIAAWLAAAAIVTGLAAPAPASAGSDGTVVADRTTGWGHCCS
jgi:hypothetical protein